MELKKILSEELKNPLPGIEFHMKMLPEGRPLTVYGGNERKDAAVAILLCKINGKDQFELILIKRTEYDGHHSGQVSFPGGKADRTDSDLLHTAIRETFEEIGVHIKPADLIGTLTPLYIQVSKFMVYPFIFYQSNIPEFSLDTQEVQYIIHYNVAALFDDKLIQTTPLNIRESLINVPYYAIAGEIVWGATAMILSELVEVLRRIAIKNSGLF
jgi:8-oxo-dGTP pyrophosphatase MutT (NUDIX family)